ncbi:hypothetical protein AAC387_Pa09g1654 [Persea americana]
MTLKSLLRRTQPSKTSYLPRPSRHFYKIRATAGPSVAAATVANMLSPWTIIPALVMVSAVAVATFVLEFIKRTERKHSSVSFYSHASIRDFLPLLFSFLIQNRIFLSAGSAAAASEFFQDPISSKQVACPSISDPAEKYMSLIIPAFNEEQRLPGALEDTMNYLQERAAADKSFTYEYNLIYSGASRNRCGNCLVVIVDDGSTDGTSKVAFDFVRKHTIDNVRVILLERIMEREKLLEKQQLIEAMQFCESIVKQGMLHSRGELLLMVDADGATKVMDLEKLEYQICTLAEKEFKSGGRTHGNLSPKISDIAVAAFGSRAHLEKQALATMFTRAAARKLFTNIRLKRWCFEVELVYLSKCLNIPMIEVSVNWSEIAGSKVRLTSIMHMLFELVLIRLGYGLGLWKILM